jgi:hypothetical protein
MAGRKPRGVQLRAEDIPRLEALVRRGKTEQRVARRARILLEIHRGKAGPGGMSAGRGASNHRLAGMSPL